MMKSTLKKKRNRKFKLGAPKTLNNNDEDKYLPKWIKEKLETELINMLDKLSDKEILDKIKQIVFTVGDKKNGISDRTITWRYSLIKKKLKPRLSKELSNKIKPPNNLTDKVIKENIERRNSMIVKQVSKETIQKILSFETSKNPYEMYIYLMFITGRRLREILDGTFRNEKGTKNIFMTGLKKTRQKELEDREVQIIPLVAKTKFFRVYRKLKNILKYSNIKHIENNLQKNIKTILGPEWKTHDLRRAYGIYMWKHRNPQRLSINPFLQKVLNHSSIDTSIHYCNLDLSFNEDIVK